MSGAWATEWVLLDELCPECWCATYSVAIVGFGDMIGFWYACGNCVRKFGEDTDTEEASIP